MPRSAEPCREAVPRPCPRQRDGAMPRPPCAQSQLLTKPKPSSQAPALPPGDMSPTTVDSKLGDGASKAGWIGKLYGRTRTPQYSHPVYGRNHTSAKGAKDAWVSRAN